MGDCVVPATEEDYATEFGDYIIAVKVVVGLWQDALDASKRVLAKKNSLSDVRSELPNAYNSVENILALEEVMPAQ